MQHNRLSRAASAPCEGLPRIELQAIEQALLLLLPSGTVGRAEDDLGRFCTLFEAEPDDGQRPQRCLVEKPAPNSLEIGAPKASFPRFQSWFASIPRTPVATPEESFKPGTRSDPFWGAAELAPSDSMQARAKQGIKPDRESLMRQMRSAREDPRTQDAVFSQALAWYATLAMPFRVQVALTLELHNPNTWRYRGRHCMVLSFGAQSTRSLLQLATGLRRFFGDVSVTKVDEEQRLLAVGPIDWVQTIVDTQLAEDWPLAYAMTSWRRKCPQWSASYGLNTIAAEPLVSAFLLDLLVGEALPWSPNSGDGTHPPHASLFANFFAEDVHAQVNDAVLPGTS